MSTEGEVDVCAHLLQEVELIHRTELRLHQGVELLTSQLHELPIVKALTIGGNESGADHLVNHCSMGQQCALFLLIGQDVLPEFQEGSQVALLVLNVATRCEYCVNLRGLSARLRGFEVPQMNCFSPVRSVSAVLSSAGCRSYR